MIRLTRAQTQPIGLDIGSDSVRMLQLEVSNHQLTVVAAAQHQLPEEAKNNSSARLPAAVEVIKQILGTTHGFVGRRVVVALPREIVHVKNLRLPIIPATEVAAAVQFEARNIFPFDPDQAKVHFIHAGEVRQGSEVRQEVIILAAPNQDIDNYLETIHGAGVEVDSLDVESMAIFRSYERFIRRREDEHEVQVIVDIGAKRSQILIAKGREISFMKSLDIGGVQLVDAVSRKLGITTDEARGLRRRLAETTEPENAKRDPVRQAVFDATRSVLEELGREISLCLRYYSVTFRGHRPRSVRLVGGEGSDPQVAAVLNSMLTIPVEAGKPLYSVDTSNMKPNDRRGTMSEWTLAFGLGLRRTNEHFGSRDGKARTSARPADGATGGAEVVDLNKAFVTTAATAAVPPEAAATGTSNAPHAPIGAGHA